MPRKTKVTIDSKDAASRIPDWEKRVAIYAAQTQLERPDGIYSLAISMPWRLVEHKRDTLLGAKLRFEQAIKETYPIEQQAIAIANSTVCKRLTAGASRTILAYLVTESMLASGGS